MDNISNSEDINTSLCLSNDDATLERPTDLNSSYINDPEVISNGYPLQFSTPHTSQEDYEVFIT